jgi:hypothetical protein
MRSGAILCDPRAILLARPAQAVALNRGIHVRPGALPKWD